LTDLSRAALKQACEALGLAPAGAQLALLGRYAGLVRSWNQKVNLVSRRDADRILAYHVLDSLAASSFIPPDSRVADIGSGAGLPGIPLAICREDVTMFLVESIAKKARFLEAAVAELGLPNVKVLHARAESLEPLGCRVVLSRLTGEPKVCLDWLLRHCAPSGSIVLWKTPESSVLDPKLLARTGLHVRDVRDVSLPVTRITRRLVILSRS